MTGASARRAAGVCVVPGHAGRAVGTVLTACDGGKPTVAASPRATASRTAAGVRGRIVSRQASGRRPRVLRGPCRCQRRSCRSARAAAPELAPGVRLGGTSMACPRCTRRRWIPPGGTRLAGIAWMDTALLSARLYSGSKSPGGGPYRYTAPVQPAQAVSLVAAFNGGFKMADAHGGYYTEGRMIDPLVQGAASLVIYASGRVTVGAWGTDVRMTPDVVAVRQNLVPLVVGRSPHGARGQRRLASVGLYLRCFFVRRLGAWHRAPVAVGRRRHRRRRPGLRRRSCTRSASARRAPGARRGGARHAARHQPVVAGVRQLRARESARSGGAVQRQQAARHDPARAVDVLRAMVGARLHHDVGASRRAGRTS